MNPTASENKTFNSLGIAPRILEILDKLKFINPTPIQYQSIPTAIEGKDLMGVAQTGTGKTLAFGIPMIQRLAQDKGKQGLVVLPTRELALQVSESLMQVGKLLGLKTAVLIGGQPIPKQIKNLQQNPHIIIATPGRLIDHLEQKTVRLDKVIVLVLDEADRMLDMGFAPQINKILKALPTDRQTMLFSATIPQGIVSLATKFMKLPIRVEVAPTGSVATDVTQELFIVKNENKLQLLEKLLTEYKGSVLIFSRTKFGVKKITAMIRHMGHSAAEIHSNRSLNQRLDAINGFKLGRYRILIATDIAARGLDVSNIELVINYDLPEQTEDYVHRIGRTARAGRPGHAISFAMPDQISDVKEIEHLIKNKLPISPLPQLPEKRTTLPPNRFADARPSRFQNNRPSRPDFSETRPSRPTRFSSERSPRTTGPNHFSSSRNNPKRSAGYSAPRNEPSHTGRMDRHQRQHNSNSSRRNGRTFKSER
ncbi:MAG: DEAD/DEAH box helicase [Candidatus Komeilibacteria bacterium]|nr:DEAD/DEAH box helicase [Candidatus Komeilibacteria bacterium]